VTSGTSPAMFLLFSVLIEQGDEVIISNPHYACYPNFIKFAGGIPVEVPVFEEDGFQYKPEEIEKRLSEKTKAIFINSPANPTGTLLSDERMEKIAGFSPYILSDEIYHGLVYGGVKERSILEFTENAFVLNGFSKLYAMTGLRLGFMIAPQKFMRAIQKVQQNFFIAANTMVQKAGVTALQYAGEDTRKMRDVYDQRRKYMIKRLRNMGFKIPVEPTGAFMFL
jgi:aspartate/methionine/tyrosine aminotransferase